VTLADAGYWSNDHIDSLRERGITPIVAPDTTRGRPRKTRLGGPYDFMRRVLDTERGGDSLARKQQCGSAVSDRHAAPQYTHYGFKERRTGTGLPPHRPRGPR
jgi:hypothetical protein